MKKLFYFLILSFFACQSDPLPQKEINNKYYVSFPSLVRNNISAFEGTILGKYTVGLEYSGSDGFLWQMRPQPYANRYLDYSKAVEGPNYTTVPVIPATQIAQAICFERLKSVILYERLQIITPTISVQNYKNFDFLRTFFAKGKREIVKQNDFMKDLEIPISTFAITHELFENGKQTYLGSAFGEQNGSSFEILESQEYDKPVNDKYSMKGFYLKIAISCKLYDKAGVYAGEVKDLNVVVNFSYLGYF